ncbi:MAG TPA: hypothetical protein VIW69_19610 [Candidatus Elarobacter sp.]
MSNAAWRLVSFGNAFLVGRYDGDRLARAALTRGIARWRFETLIARPHGILPVRTVAHDPYGWFHWLRRSGYNRLTLLRLSPAEYASLDGPLKVFTTREAGYMIGAEHASELPMLWIVWRTDQFVGWFNARATKVAYRGSNVFAVPARDTADVDTVAARLEVALTEEAAATPDDAATFAHARAALVAREPEALLEPAELPMLAPSTHPLGARRLRAAVVITHRTAEAENRRWRNGESPRSAAYGQAIVYATLVAVNSLSYP